MMHNTVHKDILISGGGIAGLTLGILLHKAGWKPVIIERDPALRTGGYMLDFWGTGWDTAERLGILGEILKFHYPIDVLQYVNRQGKPYITYPVERLRKALEGRYTFLLRSDLEKVLFERASALGIEVRFGASVQEIDDTGTGVGVKFEDGSSDYFALVFGADGVHSRVRELVFGPEGQFDRFLGYYVAGFRAPDRYGIGKSLLVYEEPGRVAFLYPLDGKTIDVVFVFAHQDAGFVPHGERLQFTREQFKGTGWILESLLNEAPTSPPIFFDSLTQIVMPGWSKGRVALLGDACGCLTLISGQGSHMAMAGSYILSHELERSGGDYQAAFHSYEAFLKPFIRSKQDDAVRLSGDFVPSRGSMMWVRQLMVKFLFSRVLIKYTVSNSRSILESYQG